MIHQEDKVGIYVTVIVHLAVLIVLLCLGIGGEISGENTFVLDFTKQEELEKAQKLEEEMAKQLAKVEAAKERLQQEVDEKMASIPHSIRNIAVNKGLKDDRGTDASKLYKDNERLQNELKKGYTPEHGKDKDAVSDPDEVSDGKEGGNKKGAQDSRASVLAWQLDGREAYSLPTPSFKCVGSGEITVIIKVGRDGRVKDASIQSGSPDPCLRAQSVAFAKRARFSKGGDNAPDPQTGSITYQFIAQ